MFGNKMGLTPPPPLTPPPVSPTETAGGGVAYVGGVIFFILGEKVKDGRRKTVDIVEQQIKEQSMFLPALYPCGFLLFLLQYAPALYSRSVHTVRHGSRAIGQTENMITGPL